MKNSAFKIDDVLNIIKENQNKKGVEIANILNSQGLKTKTGRFFTPEIVSKIAINELGLRKTKEYKKTSSFSLPNQKDNADGTFISEDKKDNLIGALKLEESSKDNLIEVLSKRLSIIPKDNKENNDHNQEKDFNNLVFEYNGITCTTSLILANIFDIRHDNVLRDIEVLDVPIEFFQENIELSSYINNQNKEHKMYIITKDAFTLIAMSYTSPKAMQYKLAFLKQFKEMEEIIKNNGFQLPKTFPEALKKLAEELEAKEKIKLQMNETTKKMDLLKKENEKLLPKAISFDLWTESSSLKSIKQIGYKMKRYGLGPNIIFDFLRKNGILVKVENTNYPHSKYSKHFLIEGRIKKWTDKETGEERSRAFEILKALPSFYTVFAELIIDKKIISLQEWQTINFEDVPDHDQCY